MKSPFPGMDPYLERHWLDVHTRLVTYTADLLNERLPRGLIASTEERVALEALPKDDRPIRVGPDVKVFGPPRAGPMAVGTDSGGTATAPWRLVIDLDPITERRVRIIEAGSERLVTVIEYLSPTNKRRPGSLTYRRKRHRLLAGGVSVVEVDLVRSGNWANLLKPHRCPRQAASPYRVAVRVPDEPEAVYLHPIRLAERLPVVDVPLRSGDPSTSMPIQLLFDLAYEKGRYDERIDYRGEPDPPLDDPDAAWAEDLLKAAGRR